MKRIAKAVRKLFAKKVYYITSDGQPYIKADGTKLYALVNG